MRRIPESQTREAHKQQPREAQTNKHLAHELRRKMHLKLSVSHAIQITHSLMNRCAYQLPSALRTALASTLPSALGKCLVPKSRVVERSLRTNSSSTAARGQWLMIAVFSQLSFTVYVNFP